MSTESTPIAGEKVGRVGFAFNMSNAADSRVNATRTGLQIHPDGNVPGTMGCIGIVGDEQTQDGFYYNMQEQLRKSGGRCTLTVEG